MDSDVWTGLEPDAGRELWAEFADRYQVRAGMQPESWPGIREPTPSTTWSLAPILTSADFVTTVAASPNSSSAF